MAQNTTVDQFVIELGFSETVMKGLSKLEKQIVPVATRIEKKLNSAFKVDAAKQAQPGINRLIKNVDQASRKINRTLNNAFRIGNINTASQQSFERGEIARARRIAKELRDAYKGAARGAGSPPGGGNPRPSPFRPQRITARERITELADRQRTSAAYGRMQLTNPAQAQEYSQRLNSLRNEHLLGNADVRGFRNSVRNLNYEYAQQARAASLAARAQHTAAAEAGSGFSGLAGQISPLVAGFISLQAAMKFFGDSLKVGAQQTQAKTMMSSAFGQTSQEITNDVNTVANKYGLNELDAQQQAAQLRFTMPTSAFSDKDIPKLLENESVFAHLTGASQDQVGLMNYGMQQVANTSTLSMQDWKQITTNMPALNKYLMELTHTSNAKELFEYMKKMKDGGARVKLVAQAMDYANKKANAYEKAMHSIVAAQGRYVNSTQHIQGAFFNGFEHGFSTLLDSVSGMFDDSTPIFEAAGEGLGWFFDRLTYLVRILDTVSMNVQGYAGLIKESFDKIWNSLSPETQENLRAIGEHFNHIASYAIGLTGALAMAFSAAKIAMFVRRILSIGGAMDRAGSGGLGGAARGGMGIAGKIFGAAAAIEIGTTLGNYVFDQWIPAFQKFAYGDENGKVEYTNGGNTVKGSPAEWLWNKASAAVDSLKDAPMFNGNWTGATSPAGALPGMGAPSAMNYQPSMQLQIQQPQPIQIAPFTINVPQPDGSMFQQVIQAQIMNQQESSLIAAGGTGGSWQSPSFNAGWSPSTLGFNR